MSSISCLSPSARKSELNRIGYQVADEHSQLQSAPLSGLPQSQAVPTQPLSVPSHAQPPQPVASPRPLVPPPPLSLSIQPPFGAPFATSTPSVKPVSPVTLKVSFVFFFGLFWMQSLCQLLRKVVLHEAGMYKVPTPPLVLCLRLTKTNPINLRWFHLYNCITLLNSGVFLATGPIACTNDISWSASDPQSETKGCFHSLGAWNLHETYACQVSGVWRVLWPNMTYPNQMMPPWNLC